MESFQQTSSFKPKRRCDHITLSVTVLPLASQYRPFTTIPDPCDRREECRRRVPPAQPGAGLQLQVLGRRPPGLYLGPSLSTSLPKTDGWASRCLSSAHFHLLSAHLCDAFSGKLRASESESGITCYMKLH